MAAIVPFETLPQLITGLFNHHRGKNKMALGYKDKASREWKEITWEALEIQVQHIAGFLYDQGIRKGDRVGILSENRPEWAMIDMALQMIGAVNVSFYTTLPPKQVAYILKDAGVKTFFVSSGIQYKKAVKIFDNCPELTSVITMSEPRTELTEFAMLWTEMEAAGEQLWEKHQEAIAPIGATVEPDELAVLIYTSGTTGNPKGVVLTHRNLCSNAESALNMVPIVEGDHHLSFLPLCHSLERTAGYTALLAAGGRITYAESVDQVSKNLVEVSPSIMISVPRLFERVYNIILKGVNEGSPIKKKIFNWSVSRGMKVAERKTLGKSIGPILGAQYSLATKLVFSKLHAKLGGNLRFAVSGGAALPRVIGEFFMAAGVVIIEGYGLTETSPVTNINPFDDPRFGTVGHVMPGVIIGIRDLKSQEMLVELAGSDYPSSLDSEAGEIMVKGPNVMKGYWNNDASTAEAFNADGWFHTGDVGKFTDGYLSITDRIKHMIVSKGGKNIYPGPIEETFVTDPSIDQLLVIGEAREFLSAFIVPAYDVLEKLIKEATDENVTEPAEIIQLEVVQQHFTDIFKKYSRTVAAHEKIRRFHLMAEPFTIENGMMTPSMKLKRKAIETAFAGEIDAMYQ